MKIRVIYIIIFLIFLIDNTYSQDTIANEMSIEELNFNLILAADSGNAEAVLDLLKKGADVNAKTSDGISALMYASQNGHLETVRVLAANGANINDTPFSRETALFAAVRNNYDEIVHYLLIKGADPNISNSLGNNPIHYAVLYNYYLITDMLIFYKADIESKAWGDLSPLSIAVYYQDYPISKLLLEKGADPNTTDSYYFTPLMFACQNGDLDIVKMLIDYNADISKTNSYNNTALDIAIKYGYNDIVNYLLDADTLKPVKDRNYNNSYKLAVISNQTDISKQLLRRGAKGKYNPFFSKLFFSYGPNFNLKHFLVETKFGVIESKYKLGFDIGIANHYWPKRILIEEEENVFTQLWEKRSLLFCDIEKRINFNTSPRNQKGMFIGARGTYTFGNYNGIDQKIEDKFIVSPQIGLFTMSNYMSAKINYEYIDFGVVGIPKHRINMSFIFFINLFKQKYSKREVYFN